MLRVTIRSRIGNTTLVILGVLYAFSAMALLVWHGRQTWGATGTIDRGVQFLLVLTVLAGCWFVYTATCNLRYNPASRASSSSSNR